MTLGRPALLALLLGALLAPMSPAAAADKITLGAVGSATAIYWPFFVGQAKGFFAAEGIELDIVYAQSSAAIMQQLAANSVDVTIGGGLVDPIRAIEKGAPLAVARILVQAPPYTLVAKPAIKSIPDLKGKTISIGGAKDITKIYIERMLTPSGLKDTEAEIWGRRLMAAFPELEGSASLDAVRVTACAWLMDAGAV